MSEGHPRPSNGVNYNKYFLIRIWINNFNSIKSIWLATKMARRCDRRASPRPVRSDSEPGCR